MFILDVTKDVLFLIFLFLFLFFNRCLCWMEPDFCLFLFVFCFESIIIFNIIRNVLFVIFLIVVYFRYNRRCLLLKFFPFNFFNSFLSVFILDITRAVYF